MSEDDDDKCEVCGGEVQLSKTCRIWRQSVNV
mgnify:CR=1 FL=1